MSNLLYYNFASLLICYYNAANKIYGDNNKNKCNTIPGVPDILNNPNII